MDCKGGEGSCQRFVNLRQILRSASLSSLSSAYARKIPTDQDQPVRFSLLKGRNTILVGNVRKVSIAYSSPQTCILRR
jgi:hypothetical protein